MNSQSQPAKIARQYAEQVVAGEILACRWVQRACQRQLDDLAKFKGKASPYLFNPKLTDKDGRGFQPADNLCAFIERLPHVKGPLAGEPIHLEPWQAFILTTVFGWVKPNGTRRFRRSYIEVPRGNAKSTLSSAVALYMLSADREGGAEVYSLATTRDQARIVFGDAQTMARRSPGFRRRFSVEVGAHNMHVLASGSKFEALSAEGSTLDGLNIHFGCVDELHAHKTRTVYDVVETGTGKRAAIDRESALIAEEARMAMLPDDSARGFVTVTDNREADPRHGFKSVGEFLKTVCHAQKPGNGIDERLLIGANRGAAVPANFGAEGSGQDGGFLVPPQFAQEIFQLSLGEDSLLPMTDNVEITGNTMAFPKDETTPWGTNGIRAYWQGEATPAAGTKPVLGLASLRLKKLMALVPVTDELLDDTNALSTYLPDKIATSIRWKTNESILFGSGTGVPMGCMSGVSTVTVAKETGQAAQTLLAQNLAKMISRLPPGSFSKAVWIVNNDVLPALFTLTLGNYPIYLPVGINVGGIQVSPYGSLLGRPVFVSQHANTFSGQGDVLLADLSYYQTITKAGGMQTATSMHLYFDADLTAFRTTFRMDGQSKLAAPISPAKGSASLSPFVQLGAR